MKLKTSLVIRLHGSDAYFCDLEGRVQKKKNFWMEKKGLEAANHIVSVSDFTAKKTTEIFDINNKIDIIYNGINIKMFSPTDIAIEENSLLYFGSVIRKKGVLALAKAFNLLHQKNSNATLTFLGKDVVDVLTRRSTVGMIKEILSEDALQSVSFINQVPYHEVKDYLGKAQIVVLPSYAEAFPMTWLEAMAMEKTLVTSNVGWAKEMMIDGKTGYTIDPDDTEEFANRMNELLLDKEKARAFGLNAREHVIEHFEIGKIATKNINYYRSIVS
ncbi:MAG: glycosyltransferase family 4 protein [Flavobacteriaceae bacterium]|nr:glycosyltransferase family 4 protein [Flavobacteriaceae bacterium]